MRGINDFMKRRAEIEAEYSRSLQRLVKPYRDEIAKKAADKRGSPVIKAVAERRSSTSMQAWTQILTEAENVATVHQTLSDRLDHELRKTVKYQANDNEKKIREMFDDIRKANLDMQKQLTVLEKNRERFETEKRNMEIARGNYDRVAKNPKAAEKDLEQAKTEAEKRALAATDAMDAYQQCIGLYVYIESPPYPEVQTNNENFNIRATRMALVKYHEFLSAAIPPVSEALEAMCASVQKMSAENDSNLLILHAKTDEQVPPDYLFEEKASAKDVVVKRPAQARSLARSASLRTVDKDDDDLVMALPPKKARRAAAERVKALEKDQVDLEKKKQAVELLLSAYQQKPTKEQRNLDELVNQSGALAIRLDNIGLRRHRLLSFISSIDKQPAPELPAHLIGKSIQALPTYAAAVPQSASPLSAGVQPPLDTGSAEDVSSLVASPIASNESLSSPVIKKVNGSLSMVGESTGAWTSESTKAGSRVRMLYDFEAAPGSQELSVSAGDILEVLERQDDG
ncbi:hypothetical protein HK405_009966 [Cladochytrium tenue]|nr:hypothetical protein HK405_009966 [Cladochytrium tenue]